MASNDLINDTTSTAPAEGERRAMIGYLPQYEMAAWAIIRHLREHTLESIRLGDLDAGRVDDFVILSTNAVDGYSVKWSEHRGFVTFNDLIRPRDKAPCLIAQLADGWKRFRASYQHRRVTVHLVTCDNPSKHCKCPSASGEGESFAAFYHQAWLPFHSQGHPVPTKWQAAWDVLQTKSELSVDEFGEFAQACQLDFNARTAADQAMFSKDDIVFAQQIKELAGELANIVRDPSRQIEVSRDDLLRRVGWSDLVEYRHQHEFPIREPYEPIETTVQELLGKISKLSGGYIALLGSPGSGKSTLLTRALEAGLCEHRLVKYYAFVPGSVDPRARGESVSFLHDLVLSLERAGFRAGQSQGIFERSLLLERLHKQLQLLGDDFARSGFPTIILVDGLDHIPREQNPQHSLIGDLPAPDQVPEGVYFVLGSQTDNLPGLPPAVLQSIREDGRRVMIGPLTREAMLRVIAASKLSFSLTSQQQESVVTLAGGHPLALSLLLNRLKAIGNADQVDAALSDTVAFTGDVDKYYFAHWQQIESLRDLAELLGLLARLRRPIDLDWVTSWEPPQPLGDLKRRFGHFFREEQRGHWVFFHNSFRQYVLTQSVTLHGGTPEAAERKYNATLAAICDSSDSPHSWEVVYHLAKAEDFAKVLDLATPEYFRDHLCALRPIESISRDARHVALAAGRQRDVAAIVQTTLFLSELGQRAYSLDAWKVGRFLLSIGRLNEALEYLWEGNELQIDSIEALVVARKLFAVGHEPLARRIYEASEPLSLIQPANEREENFNRELPDLLRHWVEAAPLFRPVEEVIELIKGFVPPKSGWGHETSVEEWRCNLFYWATRAMERLGRMADASLFEEALKEIEGGKPVVSVWLSIHRFRERASEGNVVEAKAVLEGLVKSPAFDSFSDHAKLLIAQAAPTLLGQQDIAAQILKTVKQPAVSMDSMQEPSFADSMEVFRFYRLLMLTGDNVSPNTVAPNPTDPEKWPQILLTRALVQLSKVSADAARGRFYKGFDVRQNLYHPLRLYQRKVKERRRWHGWYRVEGLRKEFDQLLVDVVQEHGPDAVDALRAEMERLWADNETAWVWPPDAWRNVVMALFYAGVSEEWTKTQLEAISKTMLDGKDVSGKVDECEAQAKAWRALDHRRAAIRELERMVSVSFGVGYRKDYQMDEWVEWLAQVLPHEPPQVSERIALFAAAIAATEETTEGRGTQSAALALIKCSAPVSPRRAVALIHWFEKFGCIHHASAVDAFLQTAAKRQLCTASTLEAVFTHFLLTFSTDHHAELARLVLSSFAVGATPSDLVLVCKRMVRAIKTRALPTARPFVLEALAETAVGLHLSLDECGLDVTPAKTRPESEYEFSLKLKDGTTLRKEEVLSRAATVDGFISLLDHNDGSFYHWSDVVDILLPKLSHSELTILVQNLPADFSDSLALSRISRCLSEMGDRNAAWQVGEQAITSSSSYGWMKYVDGGTRIEALAALVAADPTRGRGRAIEEITASLSSDSRVPFDIARRLIDIVPLLDGDLKPEVFYPLVEEYVTRLSEPLHLLDDAHAIVRPDLEDDTVERAVCGLLAYHMAGLVPLLAQGAMRAMVQILLNGSTAAERTAKEMLSGSPFQQSAAVALLECLASVNLEAVRPFADVLPELVLSRNWWASKTAEQLCRKMELDDLPERPRVALPPIYSFVLPPSNDKMPSISPDEPFPESDEPRDLVRPFDFQIEIIARMAGLDEDNLLTAAANEMKQISEPVQLTVQSERAYRSLLERAGLKFPFRRLRGAIAREAIRRIASDLIDARLIPQQNVPDVYDLLSFTDPLLALIEPVERPAEVQPITGHSDHGTQVREWVAGSSPSLEMHLREVSGMIALAEKTNIKGLDWSSPMETRVSLVGEKTRGALDEVRPFERVFDVRLDTYYEMEPPAEGRYQLSLRHHVILENQWHGADTDGVEWLALNPQIAKKIGWSLAEDGLFRWLDKSGHLMVETVWWKDGCVDWPPYEREAQVAEGFLVLASPAAASEIMKLITQPVRFLMIQRSCAYDNQRFDGPAVQTSEPFVVNGAPPTQI